METPTASAPPARAALEQDDHVRIRLLNAAVRVFDRKGYASASVREIAEMAGVTKPALYYHFGSKEGVLLAVLRQAQEEFAGAVDQAVARTGTARNRIAALCEDIYGLFGRHVPGPPGKLLGPIAERVMRSAGCGVVSLMTQSRHPAVAYNALVGAHAISILVDKWFAENTYSSEEFADLNRLLMAQTGAGCAYQPCPARAERAGDRREGDPYSPACPDRRGSLAR